MIVSIFDYGAGNLHSIAKALEAGGATVRTCVDPVAALAGDAVVLPGVGAFAAAAERLAPGRERMRTALEAGLPCLGVCLGMQLLFEGSEEGPGAGLGIVRGRVTRLAARRVPQIGWNAIDASTEPLMTGTGLASAYYANSYVCRPADAESIVAWSEHEGDRFAAAVRRGATIGVQFHPEKSSRAGLAFVRAWLTSVAR